MKQKKNVKAGLLILLLAAPVFLYLLFTSQTTNYYNLPIFGPRVMGDDGDTVYHRVPIFSFNDAQGREVTSELFKDKIYIADFFFSRCEGICPKMNKQLERVQNYFEDDNNVLILSHSVDPSYDQGEVLSTYAERFQAKSNKWFFVTGDADSIYEMATKGYFVVAGEEDTDAKFVHSEKLVLIDKKGQIRGYYDGTDTEDVNRLILEIGVLYQEEKQEAAGYPAE